MNSGFTYYTYVEPRDDDIYVIKHRLKLPVDTYIYFTGERYRHSLNVESAGPLEVKKASFAMYKVNSALRSKRWYGLT